MHIIVILIYSTSWSSKCEIFLTGIATQIFAYVSSDRVISYQTFSSLLLVDRNPDWDLALLFRTTGSKPGYRCCALADRWEVEGGLLWVGEARGVHFVIREASRGETAGWWASQLFSRELAFKSRISSFKLMPRGGSWWWSARWHY